MNQSLRHVAVIDIGKTNVKLLLIDGTDYHQIASRSLANTVIKTPPYPHYDVERIWQFILDGLTAFHREHKIDGISITTHGATAALIGGETLLLPVLDYEFEGPNISALLYNKTRGLFSETLSPRLPNGLNLGAQIFWQMNQFPKIFAKITDILMYPQFWAWKLTGIKASEVTSLGTHTDLWNPNKPDFSKLVDIHQWRPLFPTLHPAASTLGTLSSELAKHTGLPATTPVSCGIHDSNASLLPYLKAIDPPFTVISSGTWTIIMTIGGDTEKLDEKRDNLANVDAFGAAVPTARFMGGREFDILVDGNTATPNASEVKSVLQKGITILPAFEIGVGPFPAAKGKWVGNIDTLTPGERTAAASLYLALMTTTCLELASCGQRIIIEGPLAQNKIYAAALAALVSVPVHISRDETGTSTGAAMLFAPEKSPVNLGEPVRPLQDENLKLYAKNWQTQVVENN